MDIYETYIICLFFNKLLSRGMKTKSYLKIYIIHLLFGYKLWIEIYSVNKPLIIVTVSHKTTDINTKPLGQELCFMPLNPVIEVGVKLKNNRMTNNHTIHIPKYFRSGSYVKAANFGSIKWMWVSSLPNPWYLRYHLRKS